MLLNYNILLAIQTKIIRKTTALDALYAKNTCVLCGKDIKDSGRIFHGQCVCASCIGHIYAMPAAGMTDIAAAAETPSVYAG